MAFGFRLPDVGEGLHEGEVVKWHAVEGADIKENAPLVSVLTDKAEVEIPSPKTGAILKILVPPGKKVRVGEIMVVIGEKGEVYSPSISTQKPGAPALAAKAATASSQAAASGEVLATPSVRKLAQELGLSLNQMTGTGPGGRVTEEDVRRQSQNAISGPQERIPFQGVRRRTAEKMSASHKNVAQVTHIDKADMTALIALRESLKNEAAQKGVKLTYLAFIAAAAAKALKEFPYFNASLDESRQEIVLKKFYNIGVAAATDHGLYAVVIRDADKKSLFDIAGDIEYLSQKAKDKKLELADISGSTFTITNIGPIGGLAATPIVNFPESAILGAMKIVKEPSVVEGQIAIRDKMNLCLSFDHRLIDGAEAAQFMNFIIRSLENPLTLI